MALDPRLFTAFERAAHDRIAAAYAEHFVPLTSLALDPLLDAAWVTAERRVLDVATGPGVAAAATLTRIKTALIREVTARNDKMAWPTFKGARLSRCR